MIFWALRCLIELRLCSCRAPWFSLYLWLHHAFNKHALYGLVNGPWRWYFQYIQDCRTLFQGASCMRCEFVEWIIDSKIWLAETYFVLFIPSRLVAETRQKCRCCARISVWQAATRRLSLKGRGISPPWWTNLVTGYCMDYKMFKHISQKIDVLWDQPKRLMIYLPVN